MRRCIFCLTVILVIFCGGCTERKIKEETNYVQGVYEVVISKSLLCNHSVGNEWDIVYTCNDSVISSSERWTVPLDTQKMVIIRATITEKDTYPDVGFGDLCVVLKDGFETTTTISLFENKGRFKGNMAQWEITCKVVLVQRL